MALVTTPVLLRRLGAESYGILVLAGTLGGLGALLDLGLTPAVVSLLSRSLQTGDQVRSASVVGNALALYLSVGAVAGVGLATAAPWIVRDLLHVAPELATQARVTFQLSALGLALNLWFAVFTAIPLALERYELVGLRQVAVTLVTSVAMIAAALLGVRVSGLMAISVGGTAAGLGIFYIVSRRLLPDVSFRPRLDRRSVRNLASFGGLKLAGSVAGALVFRFDQVAIGGILGPAAAGFYAVPSNALARVHGIVVDAAAPLLPRASRLRDDPAALRRYLLDGSRLLFIIALAVFVSVFVLADRLLAEWVGGSQGAALSSKAALATRLLVVALAIQALAAVPVTLCEAVGRPALPNGFAVVSALLHVPLVLALVPRFGISGAAAALLINSALQTNVFIVVALRSVIKVPVRDLVVRAVSRPLGAALLVGLVGWPLRVLAHGRLLTISLAAVLVALYLAVAVLIGAVRREELVRLTSRLRPGLRRRVVSTPS